MTELSWIVGAGLEGKVVALLLVLARQGAMFSLMPW